MKNPKAKRLVITISVSAILLVMLILVALYYNFDQDCCGEHEAKYLSTSGYARALGLNSFDEESIRQTYGEPENRTQWVSSGQSDVSLILDQFPGFDALYVHAYWYEGEYKNDLIQIVFKSDTLRFGRKKIGIGSSKADVHLAYLLDEKIDQEELVYSAEDYPGVDEGYYGESWCRILFCYDDNGKVSSMAMQSSAFWGW
jgi:hypothetical protein